MIDQGKSNVQAFGAGLLGFVVVMAVGGGALMVRSSQMSKAAARPEAAAAPIDLGASMPRTPMSSAVAAKERRAESPAPLIGAEEEAQSPGASFNSPVAGVVAPQAASNAGSPAPRLEPTAHLDNPGNGTSATAVVKNTIGVEKEKAAKPLGKKALPKLAPTAGGANAIASVHYGVTNRSELMGRAAGPVYNFKGAGKDGGSAKGGKMAEDMNAKIADMKSQLEKAGVPPEERAKLLKDLEAVTKGVSAEKPAQ